MSKDKLDPENEVDPFSHLQGEEYVKHWKTGEPLHVSGSDVPAENYQPLDQPDDQQHVLPGHRDMSGKEGVLATDPADDMMKDWHEDIGIALSPQNTAPSTYNDDLYLPAKGKGGGMKIGLEATLGPQVPGQLLAAKYAAAKNSALIESLGYQARADALGLMVNIREDFEHKWKTAFEETSKEIEGIIYEAEEEKNAMGELMDRVKSDRINPGQFFANVGEAGRFSAALAVGAGAMATAFGGGPNVAYDIIKSAIDRNVESQVVNMRHNIQTAYAQMNFINSIRGLANTKMNYAHYLRMGLAGITKNQLAQVQLSASSALMQLASKDVWNRFDAMVVDSEIQAVTALQSKATFKLTSLAQISQVQGYLESQRRQQAGMQQAGGAQAGGQRQPGRGAGGGVSRGAGRPPSATGGQRRSPEASPEELANVEATLQGFIQEAQERGEPLTPEQVRNKTVNLLRSGKGVVTKATLDNTVQMLERLGEGAAAQKLKGVEQADLQPEGSSPLARRYNMTIGGLLNGKPGDVQYVITDPKAWEAKGEALGKLKKAVQAPLKLYANTKQAYDLLRTINAGTSGFARYFRRYHKDLRFLPAGEADMKEKAMQLRLIREDLMEILRSSEGTRNALNLKHEIARYEIRTTAGVELAEQLFDVIRNNPSEWQARMIPGLEKAKAAVAEVEDTSGVRFILDYD